MHVRRHEPWLIAALTLASGYGRRRRRQHATAAVRARHSRHDVSVVVVVVFVEVLIYVHRNRRFITRDRSPGSPPRLSHSSWALRVLLWLIACLYLSTRVACQPHPDDVTWRGYRDTSQKSWRFSLTRPVSVACRLCLRRPLGNWALTSRSGLVHRGRRTRLVLVAST